MFVLRYKEGTIRRVWSQDKLCYVSVDISGRYYTSKPTVEWAYSTDDLNYAKVFTLDKEPGLIYFADCEKVAVKVELAWCLSFSSKTVIS